MEEPLEVRYCFVMLLAVCDPTGHVIGTDVAIARRMNIPVLQFRECIAALMEPDQNSNSKEEDGRRVVVSDCERGYRVVNYLTYRDMRDEEQRREYMRSYMRKYRECKPPLTPVNNGKPPLAQAEAAEEEERDTRGKSPLTPFFSPPAWEQVKAESVRLLFPEDLALRFFKEMESVGWIDGQRRPLRNWRIYLSKKVDFWRDAEGKKKAKERLKAEQKAEKEQAKLKPKKVEPMRGFDD